MARRSTAGTLAQQRETLKRRGHKKVKTVTSHEALPDFERRLKQQMLAHLKAGGFSTTYCADALGVSKATIDRWLADEDLALRKDIEEISANYIAAGVTLMQGYLIEIVESLMDVFRTTEDEQLAVKIGLEILDRLGVSKVNKSESVTAATLRQQSEVDIVDKTGILETVRNAPPNVQARMAEHAESLLAMAQEHADA
jgi:transcriptional regulator with XRE-family HTH domain